MSRSLTEVFAPGVVISWLGMVRVLARAGAMLIVLLAVVLATGAAQADETVDRLAKVLLEHDDARVRTQAALALGTSKKKAAVSPLCQGLNDSSSSVRAASAAALGRLKKGGASCLRERLGKETAGSSVHSVIKKALSDVEAGAAPAITGSTKYYVAIEISDKSGRASGTVAGVVRGGMKKAAAGTGEIVVAPKGESADAASSVLGAHSSVKGFLLSVKAKKPKYNSGGLKVKLGVAIFSYPGRALKGMYDVGLTDPSVSGPSEASEDELFKMAAERAMEKFLGAAAGIN